MRAPLTMLAALFLIPILAACGQRPLSADEIVERVRQTQQQTSDLHAVLAADFTGSERSGRLVIESWSKKIASGDSTIPRTMQRTEIRESDEPRMVGTLFVSDGETFWLYTPTRNEVLTGTRSELEAARDQLGPMAGPGGATGPMAAMDGLQQLVDLSLDTMNVQLLSSDESIAGQPTWKLKLTPKPQTEGAPRLDGIVESTLWVDQQRSLPLRLQIDASDAGQGALEARELSTNSSLDEALFRFTPPANAKITPIAELRANLSPQTATLDQARAQAGFPLLAPATLPEGTSLVEVQIFRREGQAAIIQNYAGPLAFSLVQSRAAVGNDREPPAGSEVRQVTVRGQPATLVVGNSADRGSLLRWREGDVYIVIAGTLNPDDALAVAEMLR